MKITIGKLRGLQQCTSPLGVFTCLALDHRQNLRRSLNPEHPDLVSDRALTDFKLQVSAALGTHATAVLLDPEYSAAQAVAEECIAGSVGLVVAVESTGYTGDPTARQSQILPGWSVEKAKRMGASAVKLLVYYHPDSPTAAEIEQFVRQVAEDCQREDLALMLEPLSYSLDEAKPLTSAEKRTVVVETAKQLTPLGVDLLKAEFPLDKQEKDHKLWQEACEELTAASWVPWILLSAAVDYQVYADQVKVACSAGASGIAVGRAVWKEAVRLRGADREEFLRDVAAGRLDALLAICNEYGKPIGDFYHADVPEDWYQRY